MIYIIRVIINFIKKNSAYKKNLAVFIGSSMDLVKASREHLALLRAVHLCKKNLYSSGPDLRLAVTAYVNCWLPSLNIAVDTLEPPPVEVAWVWHLHKTDPASYEKDCFRWYGRLLEMPHGMSPFCHSTAPLVLEDSNLEPSSVEEEFMERIVNSARNQSTFLWHVRWPEYDDSVFLEESVMRYKSMLQLMKDHPTQFIVPTYDIDNIWHTHLAFPSSYHEYCIEMTGHKIHHDDDVGNDRSPGSFLLASTAKTEQLWQSTFGSSWRKKGAMYRGEPPAWYWSDRSRGAVMSGLSSPSPSDPLFLSTFNNFVVTIFGRAFGDAEVSLSFYTRKIHSPASPN